MACPDHHYSSLTVTNFHFSLEGILLHVGIPTVQRSSLLLTLRICSSVRFISIASDILSAVDLVLG